MGRGSVTAAGVSAPPITLRQMAERHGGAVDPAASASVVTRIAPIESGGAGDLCPLLLRRYLARALASPSMLLVDAALAPLVPPGRRWVHSHAAWALAGVLAELEAAQDKRAPGRDARAVVEPGAEIDADVRIGAGAVIMAGARIAGGCIIEPNAVIYPRVALGARVLVGAGAVLGRAGFGWAPGPSGELRRMPQLGGVRVEDDVEIGPLCTVDAGTLAPTVIARGVRLDAHVHVGHNVSIGEGALVAAQSGFAGSVKVGPGVRIGGQAGISDHVRVGARAQIAAKAGVIGDIREGSIVAGYPAVERGRWLRGIAHMIRASRAAQASDPTKRRK
jgi:UDP-3-O-[3-hydroxymyristoyl] glucosamine N-acyltransferase